MYGLSFKIVFLFSSLRYPSFLSVKILETVYFCMKEIHSRVETMLWKMSTGMEDRNFDDSFFLATRT